MFFNLFYHLIKPLLLDRDPQVQVGEKMKWVFKHQDLQMLALKLNKYE